MFIIATTIEGSLRQPWTSRVFAKRSEAFAELAKAQEGPSSPYWSELRVYALHAQLDSKES